MPTPPLPLADHLPQDELYRRYRAASDSVERTHYHLIWLKSQGRSTREISDVIGYTHDWVRYLIRRYNQHGPDALRDKRHDHVGAPAMLSAAQQAVLEEALQRPAAPDGEPWSGPKVARWIEEQTGREHVHNQRGWDYLVRLGFSSQTPRPRHQQADAQAQATFKKSAS